MARRVDIGVSQIAAPDHNSPAAVFLGSRRLAVSEYGTQVVFFSERRQKITIVIGIKAERGVELFQVADTLDLLGLVAGLIQRRQQHGRQDCDNCDHDQELYKSEVFSYHFNFLDLAVLCQV